MIWVTPRSPAGADQHAYDLTPSGSRQCSRRPTLVAETKPMRASSMLGRHPDDDSAIAHAQRDHPRIRGGVVKQGLIQAPGVWAAAIKLTSTG